MGWLFNHSSRSELIRSLIQSEDNEFFHRETLKHALRGNVLWSVVRITAKQDLNHLSTGQATNVICCDLLQGSGSEWGYKSLSEDVHPFYYSCPLSYLSLAPVLSSDWREGVRTYHSRLAARRVRRAT